MPSLADLAALLGPVGLFLGGVITGVLAALGARAQERSTLKAGVAQARGTIIAAALAQGIAATDELKRLADLALDDRLRPPSWEFWHGKDGW